LAAKENQVQILKKLWVWAEETKLKPNKLRKKLFLVKDNVGSSAWHWAAYSGSLEALETLRNFAKEAEINTDELLLAQIVDEHTAFHLAAKENQVKVLKKMWVWAEETKPNPNKLRKKLFLAKNNVGFTAWHIAAFFGRLGALDILWSFAKKAEINTDELLLAQCLDDVTAFHLAAHENHVEILNKLWGWAEETKLNSNELRKKMFLAKDTHGYNAFQTAALRRNVEASETLYSWANEMEINTLEFLVDII
jgi:ankyrin repeat protein